MIDSHCHLNFDSLVKEFESIIERIKLNKVNSILSINTNPDEFKEHYNLIKKYKSIFISYGLHPLNVNNSNIISIKNFKKFCKFEKVIGIGETGLDFYYSYNNKDLQIKSFEKHIESSYLTDLPLIIHQRNSENEIIDILKYYNKNKSLKVVFHCFTGSNKLRDFCLDNNFYISLSGIISFKNANQLRETIHSVPLNLILIETDSPYLAPVPYRGKRNEPSYIIHIANFLSNFYGIPLNKFIEQTDNNFYKLFSKAIKYEKFI